MSARWLSCLLLSTGSQYLDEMTSRQLIIFCRQRQRAVFLGALSRGLLSSRGMYPCFRRGIRGSVLRSNCDQQRPDFLYHHNLAPTRSSRKHSHTQLLASMIIPVRCFSCGKVSARPINLHRGPRKSANHFSFANTGRWRPLDQIRQADRRGRARRQGY